LEEEAQSKLDEKPLDNVAQSMQIIEKSTEDSKTEQQELLSKLTETVANKEKDLKDLKEENDLSEQGIFKEPKPFKSVSAENAALESLKSEIDNVINSQNENINQLENLYSERIKTVTNKNDSINSYYLKTIETLKVEQTKTKNAKASLLSTLDDIKIATEIEKKRRIKRAAYDNEEDRYQKDRAALNVIKQNTLISSIPLKETDFDFGEEQTNNIKIVKDIKNVESGYYLVIAIHSDVQKRDDFLTKTVASGQSNVNFFYDVNTSKYYIYYNKFEDIDEAKRAMQNKTDKPFNSKMSMVKIEN
jgi:hypothetical protein